MTHFKSLNGKISSIFFLFLFGLLVVSCGKENFEPAIIDNGDDTVVYEDNDTDNSQDNDTEINIEVLVEGDTTFINNGTIYNGDYVYYDDDSNTWVYYDNSTNTTINIDITIDIGDIVNVAPGAMYVNGNYNEVNETTVIYDNRTQTLFSFDGDYYVIHGDNNSGQFQYDNSTNSFVHVVNNYVNVEEGDEITYNGNFVTINGDQINGNVLYDHRLQTTVTATIINVVNNGGEQAVWFGGDGNQYIYDNESYTWIITEINNDSGCITGCDSTLVYICDTVILQDTLVITDTVTTPVVVIHPEGSTVTEIVALGGCAATRLGRCFSARQWFLGENGKIIGFWPLGQTSYHFGFLTFDEEQADIYSASLTALAVGLGETPGFAMTNTTVDGGLSMEENVTCFQQQGALFNQQFRLQAPFSGVNSAWEWGMGNIAHRMNYRASGGVYGYVAKPQGWAAWAANNAFPLNPTSVGYAVVQNGTPVYNVVLDGYVAVENL